MKFEGLRAVSSQHRVIIQACLNELANFRQIVNNRDLVNLRAISSPLSFHCEAAASRI